MQGSTIEKIERVGKILSLMRNRDYSRQPLSKLEIELLHSKQDCPHYRRARRLFSFLHDRSPDEVGIKPIARHLKTSERNAYDFIQALRRGGLEL